MTTNRNAAPGRRGSHGFTLVELLVAISLGMFVLLGLLGATTGLLRGDAVKASRLSGETRNAAFVIERDLSRAGYNGAALAALTAGVATYTNPFAPLQDTTVTPGCVRYTYDLNSDGVQNTAAGNDERFAIVLSAGQLFLRRGGTDYDCDVTKGTWEPLLDSELLQVTDFTVTVTAQPVAIPGSARVLQSRTVTYSLTTQLKKDSTKKMTHSNTLVLPNDIVS